MKKRSLVFSFVWLACGSVVAQTDDYKPMDNYKLEQVLVVSRHNLRTPFTWNNATLARSTPNSWPKWNENGNELTTKGGALEVYMGHYFRVWLQNAGLLPEVGCPEKDDVYIYSNSRQRTVATAQFFTVGAFPSCDITVHHRPLPEKDTWDSMDPIFNYVITNKDSSFKELTRKAMNDKLNSLNLESSYRLLEELIDYKNSGSCKEDNKCSLIEAKNTFIVEPGSDPNISGPLKVGNSMAEALMMEYYEGFPLEQITWGKVLSPQQWQQLMKLRNGYQEIQFSAPMVSQNLAKPLVTYISNTLIGTPKEDSPKLILLVGHDTNIATLLSALQAEDYQLPHQYETTPIGGKVVFQRWSNKNSKQDFLKIEYVYQSVNQIRNAEKLTLDNPPQHVTLSLKGCPINAQGFCLWSDFEKVLKTALR
ncbi:bifunctional glucose-1-phosphatase/inositol phosphatase [Budvicia aquatica]|uniref:bifunctional glucose-1-phosphatase/inositol phosphatase n=1 Tax=Budvicia aquatica TaxID=82979 RepID=UPI00208B078B|nr:bifunctional glucose-1-phosphatase/inositol phosphatase [Budvicia aquatica]GKX52935.1 bifunctional glucose-1-phosphatase/inositol phosphatase [Budvicia aquatica]